LEQAHGEYVGFFDSDDLWPADYIEVMVKNLRAKSDFGAAYSKLMLFSEGKVYGQYGRATSFPSGYITTYLFSGTPYVMPSASIFRKGAWDGIRWDDALKTNNEDLDVFLRISTRHKFLYVPEVYALRRETGDSLTVDGARKLLPHKMRVMERFYFQLGGSFCVSKRWAFHQLSHQYRSLALKHYRAGNRKASIALLKMAMSYLPLDLRLYLNLFNAFLLNPGNDKMPDWRLPPMLPPLLDETASFHPNQSEYNKGVFLCYKE
jgi:glycosyltransferase involved in cell wall biosynthesis